MKKTYGLVDALMIAAPAPKAQRIVVYEALDPSDGDVVISLSTSYPAGLTIKQARWFAGQIVALCNEIESRLK